MSDMVPHCSACGQRHYGEQCPQSAALEARYYASQSTEKVNGDSRTPKFTTYEAEEAYKLGRMHGAASSEAYHLAAGLQDSPALGSAGRPDARKSAILREEAWLRAWCAVSSTFNSKVSDCDRYADACLKAFDERFPTAESEGQMA